MGRLKDIEQRTATEDHKQKTEKRRPLYERTPQDTGAHETLPLSHGKNGRNSHFNRRSDKVGDQNAIIESETKTEMNEDQSLSAIYFRVFRDSEVRNYSGNPSEIMPHQEV
jgi:hypothetical protein